MSDGIPVVKVYYKYDKDGKFVGPVFGDYRVKDPKTGEFTTKVELPAGVSTKRPEYKKWEEPPKSRQARNAPRTWSFPRD